MKDAIKGFVLRKWHEKCCSCSFCCCWISGSKVVSNVAFANLTHHTKIATLIGTTCVEYFIIIIIIVYTIYWLWMEKFLDD